MPDGTSTKLIANANLLKLPTDRAAYSDRAGWLMSKMSKLAYEEFEKDEAASLKAKLKALGFEFVRGFDKEGEKADTQAFLAKNDQIAVLSFRGTTLNFKQILTDLDAHFEPTPDGDVDRGFLRAYILVEKEVIETVQGLPHGLPLYITGHSLGGALAVIAAKRLDASRTVAACYTYGCPRVGTPRWDKAIKPPLYRVVNNADAVPAVPFSSVIKPLKIFFSKIGYFGYQHAGDIRYLTKKGELKTGSAATVRRLFRLISSIVIGIARFDWIKLSFLFRDHRIAEYVSKLHRIANERNP